MADFWQTIRRLYGPSRQRQTPTTPMQQSQPVAPAAPPSQQQVAPAPTQAPMGPHDIATKEQLIHEAGRNLRMLEITYDGVSRLVEPYSFRMGPYGRLFYGFCSIHDKIHSFKLEKITDIRISEFPFAPRWEVEL